jgi:hypothetical protein
MSVFTRVRDALSGANSQGSKNAPTPAPAPDPASNTGPDTGPMADVVGMAPPSSHFDTQRKLIDSFDEDSDTKTEGLVKRIAHAIAFLLPLIPPFAVGTEIGAFFSNFQAFSGATWPMYVLAYSVEFALTGLTYALGHAILKRGITRKNWYTFIFYGGLWALVVFATGVGQFLFSVTFVHASSHLALLVIGIRVTVIAFLDLVSIAIFALLKGQSLDKHLEAQRKKAVAIVAVNDAEIGIENAQHKAMIERRRSAHEQMAREQHERLILDINRMVGESVKQIMADKLQPGNVVESDNSKQQRF